MKVLVNIGNGPVRKYIVHLPSKALVREVRDLIADKKHFKAVMTVLSKGRFEKEIPDGEFHRVKADLILCEDSVSWDLMK